MKNIFLTLIFVSIILICGSTQAAEEPRPLADGEIWKLESPGCWGNEKGCATLSVDETVQRNGHPVRRFDYSGKKDWSAQPGWQPIAVKPGEIYEISCAVKTQGNGTAQTGVVLIDSQKKVFNWIYGGKSLTGTRDWTVLTSRFLIGRNVSAILPRFTGSGSGSFWFDDFTVRKVGMVEIPTENQVLTLENAFLKCDFHSLSGALCVTDKRSGRLWKQDPKNDGIYVQQPRRTSDRRVEFQILLPNGMNALNASFELERDLPEIVFRLSSDDSSVSMTDSVPFPHPFLANPGDRLIVPMNEGISYPVEEPNIHHTLAAYGGHGICMAFWGMMEDVCAARPRTGASFMGIYETPDDVLLQLQNVPDLSAETGPKVEAVPALLTAGTVWQGQKEKLGYARSLRFIFFDGSEKTQPHVTICKRYREYVKKLGLWVPFTEKVRRNPALEEGIDLLIGSVNVWFMGGKKGKVDLVREMQEAGIERILWSGNGTAEELKQLNVMPHVLTSRYDCYQDVMDPANEPELAYWHGCWARDAWPNDVMRLKDGSWTHGWEVSLKDPTRPRVPCGVMCDSKAPGYARNRISEELKTKPFRARFIDTTTASPWRECWHPDHPMTRSESRVWKMELLGLVGREFNLVCGAETGHEASVPFCDFYEGMMSLGPYRVPDAGRDMVRIWNPDEIPERVTRFQLGETYRLPLWELVYHDCTVSYWYWGDYSNKMPSLWAKRDLFNALYGVPPMFLFTYDFWEKNRDRFVESYRTAEPVSRLTGRSEMTDHRILSPDRRVQQTTFANGTTVTVNFGTEDFRLPSGEVIPAGKSVVRQ